MDLTVVVNDSWSREREVEGIAIRQAFTFELHT